MTINFNTEPYYDDFNEDSKFYRILYRPGYAVQARELTQMQTILQNQVSRFGNHVFKEGAMVIPGQASVDSEVSYIKLEAIYGGVLTDTIVQNFQGLVIQNSSGLKAEVIFYTKSSGADPATLFVRYTNSGDDTTTRNFANGDVIEDVDGNWTTQAIASAATGMGSIATITRGVYYIKGHFVLVEDQTIFLDKFSNTPSYRIGLVASEQIITAEEDPSLFDNAQNSFNYAAPGAHRYFIDTVLTKLAANSVEDTNFIELIRTEDGKIKKEVRRTEYAVLEETFARRTYDESGNYTVGNFEIDVREYRNNNRGAWTSGRVYLIGDVVTNASKTYVAKNSGAATASESVAPTHTSGAVYDGPANTGIQWEYTENPFYNRGVYLPGNADTLDKHKENEAKLAFGLEPGKAYVQGYEIEKVSTEFVPVQKARDIVQVNNAVVPVSVGNYVLVNDVNGLPPIDTFGEVSLYDRIISTDGTIPSGATLLGTARVRLIEWHNGLIGETTAQYKLSLFDVKLNTGVDFARKVKSVYFNGGSSVLSFTASMVPLNRPEDRLIGSATGTGGSPFTITGNGTSFQTDLIVGDVISFNGILRRVTAIASQTSLTVDEATTVTGSTIDRFSTTIVQPENTSLIFPLPYYAIQDVRSADGTTNDTIYTVYQRLDSTTISADGIISPPSISSGTFASGDETDNYIVINATTGAIIPITGTITGTGTNSISIPVSSSYETNTAVVIAAVNKSGSTLTEKSKTLVSSASVTFTTAATAQKTELLLSKADGYRIVSVKMKSGTFASPGATYSIDISDRYEFDDGQRSTHYDVSRLVLKNSYAPPDAPIEVVFDYFTHSDGDYFTKNSYPANVDYKFIPDYQNISLRDTIDFRPRINDAGTGFSGTGAVISRVPKRGQDIFTDFSYYLARKTKLAIDFSGNYFAIDGVSSLNPGEPLDPTLGLVLYNLTLEPYTFGTESDSIQVSRIDNKRYTMRDIGRLEKRIDNLEYYTSLSLLEQQTESLDIIDSAGDSRFKRGFIVDGFTGHNTGNTTSPDYVCSIDMESAELRPFYSMQNINMLEKNSSITDRNSNNYKLYGDVITLPVLSEIPLITQAYASRLENINPFAVFTFLGNVKINPSSDDWFEIDRRPDLVIDVEGNFNSIKNVAEQSGVLGTIWNAWQTQWTGTAISTGVTKTYTNSNTTKQQLDTLFGYKKGKGNSSLRKVVTEQVATQVGQSRTGIKTSLVTKIDRRVVGDRILSSAVIPYIRSRNVLVQVRGLKPGTRFYPYFDDTSVATSCTPASKIVYIPAGASDAARLATHNSFDDSTNVGGLATAAARRISGDSQVCLNRGDIITGGSSGATAVVVGKEYNPDTLSYALYVVNISGSFQLSPAESISGSISGATGTVDTVTAGITGGNLVSNLNGDIQLLFNIPNSESLRFRTGTREFKLIDNSVATGDFTSRGRANYHAEGVLETRQQTVHSVRNAELVEEQLAENRVITQTAERVVSDTGWYDPLAQTFLIEQRGGAFLSKVDIFFATKDPTIPVTLEIREVVNGYPGKRVLPFSKVTLKPEQVNLSSTTVNLNGVDVKNYDTATSFTFPSPVYVQENTEYAIVLASDSNNYRVWISQIGDIMPGSSRTISEQPYLGSLFKSQNASTWTADQTQDLKFTLYRASFATGVTANVEYVNDSIPLQRLDIDPFETRAGSNKVRVWHRDHGMTEGSKVTISGVPSAINGISAAALNTTHTITPATSGGVDLDSYIITVTTANASGYGGGTAVFATRNIQYDVVQPMVQVQTFSETQIGFGIKTTSGKSVDSTSQTAYSQETSFSGVLANESNYFNAPRMIASSINEVESLSGNRSVTMNVTMSTTNEALSPIIDTHRTSLAVISNKVNNPLETNINVSGLDDNVILSNATGVTISGSTITTSTQNNAFLTATVGKYLTIADATGSSTRLIIAIASDGSSITFSAAPTAVTGNVTLTQRERFVDEIAPLEGSAYSKYVTKKVNLTASSLLRVRFAGNIPAEASVEVYYKTSVIGSNSSFDSVTYTLMTPDDPIVNASNSSEQFYDISYTAEDMQSFDAVQLKIVMKSTNSSEVPRIKDLRIIACA